MFCIKCGNELKSNDVFCSKCGAKAKNINVTPNTIKDTKKKGKITGIGPGIVLILAILLIVFFINMTTKKTDSNYSQFSSLDIPSEEISNIFDVIKQCGFVNYEIEKDNSLDNLEKNGTIGFRIKSNKANGTLYMEENKIYAIKYADKYLYKDRKFQDNISNYILTNAEEVTIKSQAETNIKTLLKSPSTAKFAPYSQWVFSKKDGCIITQSYVDSQNYLGATIRTQFEMKTKNGIITSLKLDGEEYIK